ncbi:adenosine deaminase CECR1 [Trichoderma asperellum]
MNAASNDKAKCSRHGDSDCDKAAAREVIKAHDSEIDRRRQGNGDGDRARDGTYGLPLNSNAIGSIPDVADYEKLRAKVVSREDELSFDARYRSRASDMERRVDEIIRNVRKEDEVLFSGQVPRKGYHGQLHPRFAGDHFLSNVDLIDETGLFKIASMMPKGAHLHNHFNACLPPHVLLDIAKGMDRMFITSNLPLICKGEGEDKFENFDKCEIQFSIMSPDKEDAGDLFSPRYQSRQTMKFSEFLNRFPTYYTRADVGTDGKTKADKWLLHKLLFQEEEAYDHLQTASGAWEKFNGRTRMMKGLFNYVTAYRSYTRQCLEDFARDNIQYAEIRPTMMASNYIYSDDGTTTIDNEGIMEIIIKEVEDFQRAKAQENKFFGGLKVIYCTPRSMLPEQVKDALDECRRFKKKWPRWIAGYDLVGEEAKGYPIREFIPQLLDFRRKCAEENLDIPFLFHCGETLDLGTETDGNLVDALLLGSKRIGHGFALANHPYIMQQMKAKGICLELCPISNEILGLTPRVNGHTMYQLLANNVHCTVNSDNGALFRSSLSHDFYQVMVGKKSMGLYGWKQLVMWSLEHACLEDEERKDITRHWEMLWREFLINVIEWYEKRERETAVEEKSKM